MNSFQDFVKYYAQKRVPGDEKIIKGTDNIIEKTETSWRGTTIHKKIIIEWEEELEDKE